MRNIVNKVDKIYKLPEFTDPNFDLQCFSTNFPTTRSERPKTRKICVFTKIKPKMIFLTKMGLKCYFYHKVVINTSF